MRVIARERRPLRSRDPCEPRNRCVLCRSEETGLVHCRSPSRPVPKERSRWTRIRRPKANRIRTASAFATRPRRYRLAAIDGEVPGRAGRPNEAPAPGAEAALGGQDTHLSQSANDECFPGTRVDPIDTGPPVTAFRRRLRPVTVRWHCEGIRAVARCIGWMPMPRPASAGATFAGHETFGARIAAPGFPDSAIRREHPALPRASERVGAGCPARRGLATAVSRRRSPLRCTCCLRDPDPSVTWAPGGLTLRGSFGA